MGVGGGSQAERRGERKGEERELAQEKGHLRVDVGGLNILILGVFVKEKSGGEGIIKGKI